MRTFIYGLDDVERGEDALGQAVSRGYKSGDRETVQLAEGHRVRADALVRSARQFTGSAQELQYLNRAVDEYRKALNLYSQVPAFGDTVRQMRVTQRVLAATEQRISTIEHPVIGRRTARASISCAEPRQVSVTYTSAADRRLLRDHAGRWRLDLSEALLAAASLVSILAIALAYAGSVPPPTAAAPGLHIRPSTSTRPLTPKRWSPR